MPEGPEVKVIVNQLNSLIKGKVLIDFIIHSGRYSKKKPDNLDNFIKVMKDNGKINGVFCKGKFIWFELDNGWYIFNTLGMSGGWKVEKKEKNFHWQLKFKNLKDIWFTDIRNFGTLKFTNNKEDLDKKLKDLGVDIFTKDFTYDNFEKIIKSKRVSEKTLPEVLMNQKKISGIGNYLKSEILYASKISPYRLIKNLNNNEIKILYDNVKKISIDSYKRGGASPREYSNVYDVDGKYTQLLKVYNQKKDPFGNTVKREETKDKRTTHWIPSIQK